MAVLASATTASATIDPNEVARLSEAAQVLRETRPSIPQEHWDRARCVAVIPNLQKAAFIVGGEYGKGVMSCRAGEGWSAPLFVQFAKGSWGFQAGAEQIDLALFVMNESGVQKLLKNKVTLGVDLSVAAGPIGRHGHAGTDASLTAEVLAYSRATGLFAGVNLSGGVFRPDEDVNHAAYGPTASPGSILGSRSISAPTEATPFLDALGGDLHAAEDRVVAATTRARPANPPVSTDSDLRTTIVAMQQTVERMLNSQHAEAVGTSGRSNAVERMTTVDRDELEQLRSQIDALIATLNARGQ
jgi:lipid-binding SYLF domain-containing protein